MLVKTLMLLILGALICSEDSFARAMPQPPDCSTPSQGARLNVPQFTGYAPAKGGINGNCNGGASKAYGFPACKNHLHAYMEGKSPFIMVAAQQNGGSAELFGCWARVPVALKSRGISTGQKSCHIFAVVDRYAKSENKGNRGVNGKIQGTKIDVEVGKTDKEFHKLGLPPKGSSEVECIGRARGMTNREKSIPFLIKRQLRALQRAIVKVFKNT